MKTELSVLVLQLAFLGIPSAYAEPVSTSCNPSSYEQLVNCAEKQSSEVKLLNQQVTSSQNLEGVAKQWINPELDAENVAKGSKNSEMTATLFFTLRMGDKRGALINEAQSEIEKTKANRDLSIGQTRLAIMLGLYRLSHLKNEIKFEEESVSTFSKIVNQYQKRPALSPEQDVSLSVFKMALSDHQLSLTKLKSDEEKIYQSLIAITGLDKAVISKNLPLRKQNWPNLEGAGSIDVSPQVRVATADLKLARSLKSKAASEAWPDLKVGPSVKKIEDDGVSKTYVGFGLSMPLPVFNLNGAGKTYGSQKVIEAEMSLEQTKRNALASRNELVNRYNQTVQALKATLSSNATDEKHEKIERQFFRGVIPSSLVIEAHRQLFDLEEKRNSSELEALEALGQVLIMDNKFEGVIL